MPIHKQKNILTASCFGKTKYVYIGNRHQRQWWICSSVWATWQCLMELIQQAVRAGSRSWDGALLDVNGPVTYFPWLAIWTLDPCIMGRNRGCIDRCQCLLPRSTSHAVVKTIVLRSALHICLNCFGGTAIWCFSVVMSRLHHLKPWKTGRIKF